MRKDRILILEDDPDWVELYYQILSGSYDLDDVAIANDALELLKRKYYALVVIDLSLDLDDHKDRSSRKVQEFLMSTDNVGTLNVIVSAAAQKKDVMSGAYDYSAKYIFEKAGEDEKAGFDANFFVERIDKIISDGYKDRPLRSENTYEVFCGDYAGRQVEYEVEQALNVFFQGSSDWAHFNRSLYDEIGYIHNHKTKKNYEIVDGMILGLYWSRNYGSAVSICISNNLSTKEESIEALNKWLWPRMSKEFKEVKYNGFVCRIFIEDKLSADVFDMSYKLR